MGNCRVSAGAFRRAHPRRVQAEVGFDQVVARQGQGGHRRMIIVALPTV